jgi:hypothetical protein
MPNKITPFLLGALVGIFLSVGATYAVLHHRNGKWIELTRGNRIGGGVLYALAAVDAGGVAIPDTLAPTGKAKFLDRGLGKGLELGYIVHATMKPLDTNKLPDKYKHTVDLGGFTRLPMEEVVYASHLQFALVDADGFTLMTTTSEDDSVVSGRDNIFQGVAKDSIPGDVVARTKEIQVQLTVDSCRNCQP